MQVLKLNHFYINVGMGDANYDNYLIENTGLQQSNHFEKGNGKLFYNQYINCGMRHLILGTTAFGDDAIFDGMGNAFTDTIRRASIQLFESNEGVLKLVWRQVEQLCLLRVVANLVAVLFGYNPSYCV